MRVKKRPRSRKYDRAEVLGMRRLPRPARPVRPRCEIDDAELQIIERLAAACRLSVASFIRVALVESTAHEERVEVWKAIAAKLHGQASGARPGRPKSK